MLTSLSLELVHRVVAALIGSTVAIAALSMIGHVCYSNVNLIKHSWNFILIEAYPIGGN